MSLRTRKLENLANLYNENKKRILMPNKENHPINYYRASTWASRHCDAASRAFARMIVDNTLYISFPQFIAALETCCDRLI